MSQNPGHNPTRRNRNIGTSKQGHGRNNRMIIPWPASSMKCFYERLGNYRKIVKQVGDNAFTFVVETPRTHSFHACSIADVIRILENVPHDDIDDLDLIVFRQPKRKEEILSPVWGRLIYSYEFENKTKAAVILEAVNSEKRLRWPRNLSVDNQKEMARLMEDGHPFQETRRYFETGFAPAATRNTQLYRTLPHEIGHYVHYLNTVERPGRGDGNFDKWKKRHDKFWSIPASEKERFAHDYAETLRRKLFDSDIIPFEPLSDG